jgi:hypothetical protein
MTSVNYFDIKFSFLMIKQVKWSKYRKMSLAFNNVTGS